MPQHRERSDLDPAARVLGSPKWTTKPTRVTFTGTAARVELQVGLYEITTTADCVFMQGDATVTAVEAEDHVLTAGGRTFWYVSAKSGDTRDDHVSVVGSGGGEFCVSPI
jgi:hypothetical protein